MENIKISAGLPYMRRYRFATSNLAAHSAARSLAVRLRLVVDMFDPLKYRSLFSDTLVSRWLTVFNVNCWAIPLNNN
jgi:hypothetical protein